MTIVVCFPRMQDLRGLWPYNEGVSQEKENLETIVLGKKDASLKFFSPSIYVASLFLVSSEDWSSSFKLSQTLLGLQ